MKKILALLVICAFAIFTLVGCSNNSSNNDLPDKNDTENNTANKNNTGNYNIYGDLNKFDAKTLSGESVTQDIFKKYDVTMVNIWATWCGYCIEEMGELQKVFEELSKEGKANIITICQDASEHESIAKQVIEDNNCQFTVIEPDEYINKSLLNNVMALPTTIFVDNKGNIISEPVQGLPSRENQSEAYLKIINELLKVNGKTTD